MVSGLLCFGVVQLRKRRMFRSSETQRDLSGCSTCWASRHKA